MSDADLPLLPHPSITTELKALADLMPAPSLGAARRRVRRRLSRLSWRRRTRNVLGNGALVATVVTGGTRLSSLAGASSGTTSEELAPDLSPAVPTPSPPTTRAAVVPPAPVAPPVPEVPPTTPAVPWQSVSFYPATGRDLLLADPSALWVDGVAHFYATSGDYCTGPAGDCHTYRLPHLTAATLHGQATLQGDALPQLPPWVAAHDADIWAPTVVRVGDRYVLYFAATAGTGRHKGVKCIGTAVSPSPNGPFMPSEQPLTCRDHYWSIDPYVVADGGQLSMLWRQDSPSHTTGRIVAAPLSADGLDLAGDPRVLLGGEHRWEDGYLGDGGGIGPIENPSMARHPDTGEWLLAWSANRWENGDYATGLAVCAGPTGPCERVSLDAPWLQTSRDAAIQTSADFVGAGGLSFFTGPDGRLYAVLHAYRSQAANGAGGDPRIGWVFAVDHVDGRYVLREFS